MCKTLEGFSDFFEGETENEDQYRNMPLDQHFHLWWQDAVRKRDMEARKRRSTRTSGDKTAAYQPPPSNEK